MEECAGWLVEVLAEVGESLRPKEVVALARGAGFTRATAYRAREVGIGDQGAGTAPLHGELSHCLTVSTVMIPRRVGVR